jgi:hypothetical protein
MTATSYLSAAAECVRQAVEHLQQGGEGGTPLVAELTRILGLLNDRAKSSAPPPKEKPAAPPRVCLGCGSTKCRPGACNRATARKPVASPAVKDKPAAPPPAKPEKPQAAPATPPAKPEKPATAPDDFAGLKGYARLRQEVKDAEGLATLPKGTKADLLTRLAKAKDAKPAAKADVPPTVPGLFVPDGKGGYRPATEAEVWQALEALPGKKVT